MESNDEDDNVSMTIEERYQFLIDFSSRVFRAMNHERHEQDNKINEIKKDIDEINKKIDKLNDGISYLLGRVMALDSK